MTLVLNRRTALVSALALAACKPPTPTSTASTAPWEAPTAIKEQLDAIEARIGGRLGVSALDTGDGRRFDHRHTEAFAMCSTFKWLVAAAILHNVDGGHLALDAPVRYTRADLVSHSPVTEAHVAQGVMSVEDLTAAAVIQSDNGAANLLLARLNGPEGLTQFVRANGDPATRLNRTEPALNEGTPGDPRDTTTPDAMLISMRNLLLGEALTQASREKLIGWLIACETGRNRLRGGLPADWRAGDKTGTSDNAYNDVAIAWPPQRAPILIACYTAETAADAATCNAAHAEIGRLVAQTFA